MSCDWLQLFPQLYDVMVKPLIDARDRYEKMKQTEELKVPFTSFHRRTFRGVLGSRPPLFGQRNTDPATVVFEDAS